MGAIEQRSDLDGCVAVVTGASRGIGRGCAVELGAAGALVYLTGRTLAEGAASLPGTIYSAVAAVEAAGGRAVAVECDHRRDDRVESLFERVEREWGRLDVLVNCATSLPDELLSGLPFWELPLSNWDDMIDVGTRSAYVASAFAARSMVAAERGLIVNISSSGAREYAWHVAYGVGKAALDRLTADTAHELRPHGVAVVSVWPGLVLAERGQAVRAGLPGLDWEHAESQRFTGRAVAALAADPDVLRHTGEAIPSRELAEIYGFRDLDGRLPAGPLRDRAHARGGD